MSTTIRLRVNQQGIHTHIRVFVGTAEGTFAFCGTLVMRIPEAQAFLEAIQAGPNGPIGSGLPVEIGGDE